MKIEFDNPRCLGDTVKILLDFYQQGIEGEAVVIFTPEGDFLTPKAIDNLKDDLIDHIIKLIEETPCCQDCAIKKIKQLKNDQD